MSGVICGLDLGEAMQTLPSGLDPDFARRLFVVAECSLVAAVHARLKAEKPDEQPDKD
jgi:hypothetical protein